MASNNRSGIWLHHLPVFNGTFSWDKTTLRANVKAEKPDYDPNDPKTWPRMTMRRLRHFLGKSYDGTIEPPTGIAYQREIVLRYLHKRPGILKKSGQLKQLSGGNTVDVNLCFYRFPFTHGCGGKVMIWDRLTAANRLNWIRTITGRDPQANQVIGASQSKQPKSSAEAFNEVLEMMNDTPPDTSAEVDALRQEISRLKEKLKAQESRASSLQKEHDKAVKLSREQLKTVKCQEENFAATRRSEAKLQSQRRLLERDLSRSEYLEANLRQTLKDVSNSRKEAKIRVGILEETVTERDRQLAMESQNLEAAKKAALDADERVIRIWTEMKKSKEAEQRKRYAGGDAAGPEAKKAKLGT